MVFHTQKYWNVFLIFNVIENITLNIIEIKQIFNNSSRMQFNIRILIILITEETLSTVAVVDRESHNLDGLVEESDSFIRCSMKSMEEDLFPVERKGMDLHKILQRSTKKGNEVEERSIWN